MALNLNISRLTAALQSAALISPARFRRPLYSVGVYLGARGPFRSFLMRNNRVGGRRHG